MFKSHVPHIMPILMTFFLSFKNYCFFCLLFLLFSLSNFDFPLYFYILVLPKYFKIYTGKIHNWKNWKNHIYHRIFDCSYHPVFKIKLPLILRIFKILILKKGFLYHFKFFKANALISWWMNFLQKICNLKKSKCNLSSRK